MYTVDNSHCLACLGFFLIVLEVSKLIYNGRISSRAQWKGHLHSKCLPNGLSVCLDNPPLGSTTVWEHCGQPRTRFLAVRPFKHWHRAQLFGFHVFIHFQPIFKTVARQRSRRRANRARMRCVRDVPQQGRRQDVSTSHERRRLWRQGVFHLQV